MDERFYCADESQRVEREITVYRADDQARPSYQGPSGLPDRPRPFAKFAVTRSRR